MPTTSLRSLYTLIFSLLLLPEYYCSFNDVTTKVGISSINGLLAAFGDFNGDKSTDLFVISNQGKNLDVLLWNEGSQKFDGLKALVAFPSSVIVNVGPGDFNGDGCMDVLITTETGKPDARNIQPKRVYVFWGSLNEISKIEKSFQIPEELKDQPVILDVNGDLIPDILGTIYNLKNASLEVRTYWISVGKNKTFERQTQKANSKVTEQNQELSPLTIPHSNGFLDLTGDMTADLFVTSKSEDYKFEIWENKEGILTYSPDSIGLPDGVSARSHVIGQSSFADFDRDGKIDHLLPVCSLPNCQDSQIYIYINNKWSRVLTNNQDTWQFIPPSGNESIANTPLMTIRTGDYNMDGYPDGLIILDIITPKRIRSAPVLLENVPCSNSGHHCVNGRTFSVQWKSLMSLEGAVVATFFDLYENGITDFIIVTQTTPDSFRLHAVRNNLYVDASFVKVAVLSGVTLTSCKGDKLPYGVNQAGPYVSYTMTDNDGKVKTGAAAQLSQSGYFALQCPYIVFGLGRTPNFVDKLTIGMPRAKKGTVRSHSWPSIIPNSQMIIIPYPPDQPNKWKSKLLVTPSKLVLLTGLCMLGLCALLALVIMVLHLLEKRADQKEKREDAHKFHFDAM
ncbi:T-cell immunomodulatory protein-like [Actinia tenebrosa]|uniref:T-cell immunomodulatory protein-like n=1 Tax=Actinia tenebrosa TaxID=6105 RepID=A0A6P8I086_ACTTE|nr:T-cell immunomodulatory protein-like [Actinia tenebrosa]